MPYAKRFRYIVNKSGKSIAGRKITKSFQYYIRTTIADGN